MSWTGVHKTNELITHILHRTSLFLENSQFSVFNTLAEYSQIFCFLTLNSSEYAKFMHWSKVYAHQNLNWFSNHRWNSAPTRLGFADFGSYGWFSWFCWFGWFCTKHQPEWNGLAALHHAMSCDVMRCDAMSPQTHTSGSHYTTPAVFQLILMNRDF